MSALLRTIGTFHRIMYTNTKETVVPLLVRVDDVHYRNDEKSVVYKLTNVENKNKMTLFDTRIEWMEKIQDVYSSTIVKWEKKTEDFLPDTRVEWEKNEKDFLIK